MKYLCNYVKTWTANKFPSICLNVIQELRNRTIYALRIPGFVFCIQVSSMIFDNSFYLKKHPRSKINSYWVNWINFVGQS